MPSLADGSSSSSVVLGILSVILMAISAIRPSAFDFARTNVSDLFAPMLSMVSLPFQKLALFSHDITNLAQLQADNLRLEQENEKLREWHQVALLLDSENKSLRSLLNMPVEKQRTHVSGRIISDGGNAYVKSVLVTAGEADGVEKGDTVVSGDGLLGRIVEVSEDTSRILFVTDMNSRVPVVVEDTGHHAILAGTNENQPHLIHVPQDSEIAQGARIITSGYGGVFPPGIAIGRVRISSNDVMEVVLFSDLDRLHIVRIIQSDLLDETNR
ncbi:MAG: rod shape-determining protein MreC [Alphaproteobacteria bacterium]